MTQATDGPNNGELTALMDASATVLCLSIEPEWRPLVLGNLETALRFARLVASFPVPDTIDPANIYRVPELDRSSGDDPS